MPPEMREQSELYGVKLIRFPLDYRNNCTKNSHSRKGFEETLFTENSLDVVVANVPFADIRLTDNKTLKKYYIHDYFIKRSIDLVHEGGIVAVITSSGTMDKKDASFRKELSHKADLIGGVRLPNTAFKQIAGTEVTTDVLFLGIAAYKNKQKNNYLSVDKHFGLKLPMFLQELQREDGSVQPPMTMNNYFHKHMLTHTLGRYHFKTTEEERIRLIQERKTLADRITKGFKHDGRSISLCKNNEIILTRGIADCRRTKRSYY